MRGLESEEEQEGKRDEDGERKGFKNEGKF